jgi:hypothetical protein
MGSYTFTITGTDSTVPQQTDSATFTVVIATGQLRILTARLPGGYVGVNYDRLLESAGGEGAVSWSGTNLPPGLAVSSDGRMGGTPTAAGDFFITATVVDSGNPQQSASANYQVRIGDDLGRNDTIASATPLSNGDFTASLSPISDPPGGINPDVDVYAINMTGGATVTVNAFAQSLIDPVIEIVDASNARQSTCDSNNDGVFSESCMNDDDLISGTLDSRLVFRVPGSGVQTFYVRVVDWRGDARPELTYRINISGAN